MTNWEFEVRLSRTEDGLYVLQVGDGKYKAGDFEALKEIFLDVVTRIVNLLEGRKSWQK